MNLPRLAVLVHGGKNSIEAVRARGLTGSYPADRLLFLWRESGKLRQAADWQRKLKAFAPQAIYVVNTALPGTLLAWWWWKTRGVPFVLDTGDVIYEMARASGISAGWRLPILKAVETVTQRAARAIVVRGTGHQEYLGSEGYPRVQVIRDGYHPQPPPPDEAVTALRRRLGLEDRLAVGLMGSLVYSPRLDICYGWDLIRALAKLKDLPVTGVIIGDGNGRAWLESLARREGVFDRLVFCGRIPYAEVPLYLRVLDVALSTQTNNLPGRVRTTGKLPEYMAAERFILASRVGEATRLLPNTMLIDYEGAVDPAYPEKLANRVREIHAEPGQLEARRRLPSVAKEHCAYEVLATRFNEVIAGLKVGDGGSTTGSRKHPAN